MAIQQLLQSRQGGIPPQMMALLELEQAKQALMQSGVAPGTVAGQKVQEAQMLTQPPQQPGMQDLMPGIQQRAGEMAQAQQPVTQAQLQQAMAQRAPGIAGLPADVQMAEGGIVGYNGEERSDVELPVNERIKKAYLEYMAARERGEPLFRRSGAEALEDFLRGRPAPEAQRLAPEAAAVVARPRGQAGYGDEEISPPQETRDLLAKYPGQGRRGPAAETSPQRTRSESAPAAASAAPASGVASLMGPMMPSASDVEFGRQKAALQQMLEAAQKPTEESPQDKALRAAREAEIARQTGAIDAARQRFTESQEKQKSQDLINFLMGVGGASSLFGGMARSGQQLSQVQAAREAERIKYMDLLDTRNEAVGRLKLAQLTGDADLARESAKELRKNALEIQKLGVGLGEVRMKELAAQERNERDIEARAKESAFNRSTQLQIAKIQAAARSDPASKEALAMARVQAAINGSPALKELAKAASMGLSGAQERYVAEEARLYRRLAPELMGDAGAAPSAAPALKYNPATGKIE